MRAGGFNWAAVIAAAVAIYVIGFLIYGILVPEDRFMAMAGITPQELESAGRYRMAFGPVMPVLTAVFLALLFKWADVRGAAKGAVWAAVVALASAIPALWYGWVYGVGPVEGTILDSLHLLAGHLVAGAILGAWR